MHIFTAISSLSGQRDVQKLNNLFEFYLKNDRPSCIEIYNSSNSVLPLQTLKSSKSPGSVSAGFMLVLTCFYLLNTLMTQSDLLLISYIVS